MPDQILTIKVFKDDNEFYIAKVEEYEIFVKAEELDKLFENLAVAIMTYKEFMHQQI